ncbi:metallophosphoesterase [Neolewinella lacunae]|uniref:Metallophosphoesterase n=1 Tax=Neolewinella lacunae TaxID=1517758 RepID=A0A923PKL7_9BACT|nr:metallophosphoesterase [Neolewinella lacunae]MBC6994431.1 metallophosphoesterase [Neolewinella lacunae]MDN3633367.1 metallophosphoesterase [Neolewinella lacunae]
MPLRIVQITDLHLLPDGEELMRLDVNGRLLRVLRHAREYNPDAYFLTGDFCATLPRQEIYHAMRQMLDGLGKPYYITPGNHDDRAMLRNAFYLEGHGQEPIRGLVRVQDKNFLFLDTSRGFIDGEQVEWLEMALRQFPAAEIVMHHPPIPMGVRFMDHAYPLRETDQLLRVLTYDGHPRRVFCGHYHSGRTVAYRNLHVHLCPPTSFFIDPVAPEFQQIDLPPAYLQLEWNDHGAFQAAPIYLP